jgi:hypothetical protein
VISRTAALVPTELLSAVEGMAQPGKYRWRTWLRRQLPWWLIDLGVAPKGKHDCGAHEWYREDDELALCYHCEVGERHLSPGERVGDPQPRPGARVPVHG